MGFLTLVPLAADSSARGDVEFLRPGQKVDLILKPLQGEKFVTALEHISQAPMHTAPKGLASQTGGTLATTPDAASFGP
jgi:hypothetical protein